MCLKYAPLKRRHYPDFSRFGIKMIETQIDNFCIFVSLRKVR